MTAATKTLQKQAARRRTAAPEPAASPGRDGAKAGNDLPAKGQEATAKEIEGAGELDRTHEISLGMKLRAARKARDLSLQDVAHRAGLSIGVISQIERGLTSPSFRSLRHLSEALGIPMSEFFSDTAPNGSAADGIVVHPRDRRVLRLEKKGITTEYINPEGEGQLLMMLMTIEPGGHSGQDYDHHAGEEGGLILSGVLELWLDGVRHLLQEGDSFRFPATTPHRFGNPGQNLTRIVWFVTPTLY